MSELINQANRGPIKAVIFDWAGTTVDFGCYAPTIAFKKIFEEEGISLTIDEIRKPMGIMKKDHVRVLCQMDRVKMEWEKKNGKAPDEDDVEMLYGKFEPTLLQNLPDYTELIPGVLETIEKLRSMHIKIGSTTGYTKPMMDIIIPLVKQKGYHPDSIINSSDVPKGRPSPYMCYLNAINLQAFPLERIVKVGDTVADIKEGFNAGMWSIGVIVGSSELGLDLQEFEKTREEILAEKLFEIRKKFEDAGAHYVIDRISDLPIIIDKINSRLANGDVPSLPRNTYKLLTPGPITTTSTVKMKMLTDWGSRNDDFKELVENIRKRLVKLATLKIDDYTAIIMQGSGTFSIESVIGTSIPANGKLLVLVNGAYGKRMIQIAKILNIKTVVMECNELQIPDLNEMKKILQQDSEITHVSCVHSETTTGIINPIEKIAKIVKDFKKILIVDAMSSFGAIPIDIGELNIDFFISSPNKNLQGVPGFSYIIAKTEEVTKCKGMARSLSLDLHDQWQRLQQIPGSFRFTSPVHVIRAFHQALLELEQEGGIETRYQRYKTNQKILEEGMKELGFEQLPLGEHQGPIITTFYSPQSNKYDFKKFYEILQRNGFVIYPGKTTIADSFRIGTIGEIYPEDVKKLLSVIETSIFW
ncbi:MAG: 2-aminoethylphosphonate--pyruvate transaminase [Promethearchaeota archaeon]|nr:MAG: 2-aminoethylphosphonate--pyruvate transaminase [Candidatus Lokiarchaeota archaeon]